MWSESARRLDDVRRLGRIKSFLEKRARLLTALRSFFADEGFLEVDTPSRIRSPAPEDHINAPPCGSFFLRSSPELHMKRLVAAGYDKIFQIGPCFREGERGRLHGEEFTMLEWYEAGSDYETLLKTTAGMLRHAARLAGPPAVPASGAPVVDLDAEWLVMTVDDAFRRFGGVSATEAVRRDEFELILVDKVEPALPKDRPVVLKDYPAAMAALSRLKPGAPGVAERWELYLGGVEIANAYSELIDPIEQRTRFEAVAERRRRSGLPEYPTDHEFLIALENGMPACAGCALGIDRLSMIFCGADSIADVRSFSDS